MINFSPGSLTPVSGCIFFGLYSYIYFTGEILKAGLLLKAGPNLKRWLPGTNLTKLFEYFFNKDVMFFSDFNKYLKSCSKTCYAQLTLFCETLGVRERQRYKKTTWKYKKKHLTYKRSEKWLTIRKLIFFFYFSGGSRASNTLQKIFHSK
jgi:hypothetical protein